MKANLGMRAEREPSASQYNLAMKIAAICFAFILHASAQQQQQPVHISSGVMAGQLLHKVMPQYPQEAFKAHISGSVVMHVIIGEDGTVKEVTPVSGPQMLRQPYMDAVRQWVYKPYLLYGQPVEVDTIISLNIDFGG